MTDTRVRYEQLELFELTDAVRATAARIAEGEVVNAEDKLDLAEQMWEARRRFKGDREYGRWWSSTGIKNYGWTWRAVLVKAGERIAGAGRPALQLLEGGGEFSIERYAQTGNGWITGDDDTPSANASHGTDEYFTPAWIFEELGVRFDLDVAAPPGGVDYLPADRYYTADDNGLAAPWDGTVWMNPPYSAPAPWVDRFLDHDRGIALLPFAKSDWFFRLWENTDVTIVAPGINASKFVGGQIQMATFLAAVGPDELHEAVRQLGRSR
jgi:hypothetical protein